MPPFDTTGLTPLQTEGLKPLDTGGLKRLNTAGLTPVSRRSSDGPAPLSEQLFAGFDEYRANRQTKTAVDALNQSAGLERTRREGFGQGREILKGQIRLAEQLGRTDEAETLKSRLAEAEAALEAPERQQRFTAAQEGLRNTLQAAIDKGKELRGRAAGVPLSPSVQEFAQAKGFGEAFGEFADDPLRIIAELGIRSAPNMLEIIPASIGGALVAGPVGAAAMAGGSSAMVEYRAGIAEGLKEAGVDLDSADSMLEAAANTELMERIYQKAALRAGIIGAVDTATMGAASRTLTPFKQPLAREATNLVAQTGVQAAGGAGGESLARAATGDPQDAGAILAEGLAEGVTAPVDVAVAAGTGIRETAANRRQATEGRNRAAARERGGTAETWTDTELLTFARERLAELEAAERITPAAQREIDTLRVNLGSGNTEKLAVAYGIRMVTADDLASPIPTELIASGKDLVRNALEGQEPVRAPADSLPNAAAAAGQGPAAPLSAATAAAAQGAPDNALTPAPARRPDAGVLDTAGLTPVSPTPVAETADAPGRLPDEPLGSAEARPASAPSVGVGGAAPALLPEAPPASAAQPLPGGRDRAADPAQAADGQPALATFPVQGGERIPREVAEQAYAAYVRENGRTQSLSDIANRGGFGAQELDTLVPGWRGTEEEGGAATEDYSAASELAEPEDDDVTPAANLRGEKIDAEWVKFSPESGTLGVPRDDMPQIKAEHRGALTQFLKGKGLDWADETVPASSLKATQAEMSEAKIAKAKEFEGGDRAILVSSDGYVLDGHHQWVAAADQGKDLRIIRFNAPIKQLLELAPQFPSAEGGTPDVAAVKKPAAPEESVQDQSFREWAENYDRVVNAPDLADVSEKDLIRANAYADNRARYELHKKQKGEPSNDLIVEAMRREQEHFNTELRRRREVAKAPPTADQQVTAPAAPETTVNAPKTPEAPEAPPLLAYQKAGIEWEQGLTREGRRQLLRHAKLKVIRDRVQWSSLTKAEQEAIVRALPTFKPEGAAAADMEIPPDIDEPAAPAAAPPKANPARASLEATIDLARSDVAREALRKALAAEDGSAAQAQFLEEAASASGRDQPGLATRIRSIRTALGAVAAPAAEAAAAPKPAAAGARAFFEQHPDFAKHATSDNLFVHKAGVHTVAAKAGEPVVQLFRSRPDTDRNKGDGFDNIVKSGSHLSAEFLPQEAVDLIERELGASDPIVHLIYAYPRANDVVLDRSKLRRIKFELQISLKEKDVTDAQYQAAIARYLRKLLETQGYEGPRHIAGAALNNEPWNHKLDDLALDWFWEALWNKRWAAGQDKNLTTKRAAVYPELEKRLTALLPHLQVAESKSASAAAEAAYEAEAAVKLEQYSKGAAERYQARLEGYRKQLTIFASGMSRTKDAEAGTAWGGLDTRGIGVDIGEVTTEGQEKLAKMVAEQRLQVFMDSGAHSLFKRNERRAEKGLPPAKPLDFDAILNRYDEFLSQIEGFNEAEARLPKPLLVMPDIVGDQMGSLALVKQYKDWIRIEGNANVSRPVIAIQKGELSLADAYLNIVETVGTRNFIVGVPSKEVAVSLEEFREFVNAVKPKRLHFLGATSEKTLAPRLAVLADAGLDMEHLSADANVLRATLYGRTDTSGDRQQDIRDTLLEQAGAEHEAELAGVRAATEAMAEEERKRAVETAYTDVQRTLLEGTGLEKLAALEGEAFETELRKRTRNRLMAEKKAAKGDPVRLAALDRLLKGNLLLSDGFDEAWVKSMRAEIERKVALQKPPAEPGPPRGSKYGSTGESLRRWFDEQKKAAAEAKGTPPAVLKELLKLTQRAELFPVAELAADGTPGLKRYLAEIRDALPTFRERSRDVVSLYRDESLEDWVEAHADERTMTELRTIAEKYVDDMRPIAEAMRGHTEIKGAVAALQQYYDAQKKLNNQDRDLSNIYALVDYTKLDHWRMKGLLEKEAKPDDPTDRSKPIRRTRKPVDELVRKGLPDVRGGKDKAPADLKTEFGFADITVGGYVTSAQEQAHVNGSFEAFADLAAVLGVKRTDLSFGGTLHYAIGALGHGRHAAHYAPQQPGAGGSVQVINVTNTQGDGSVAHEMGHAIDFNLRGALTYKDMHPAVAELVRALKSELPTVDRIKDAVGRFLTGSSFYSGMKGQGPLKNAEYHIGRVISDLERNPQKLGATNYFREAQKGDHGSTSSLYWSNKEELFARAFESYVHDKLGERSSEYLVTDHVADGKVVSPPHRFVPYPQGEERKAFNALFDQFVAALKIKDGQWAVDPALIAKLQAPREKLIEDLRQLQRDLPAFAAEQERLKAEAKLAANSAKQKAAQEAAAKAAAELAALAAPPPAPPSVDQTLSTATAAELDAQLDGIFSGLEEEQADQFHQGQNTAAVESPPEAPVVDEKEAHRVKALRAIAEDIAGRYAITSLEQPFTPLDNKAFFAIADKHFGGTRGEGKYETKDAYDALELGVNLAIRAYPMLLDVDPLKAVAMLDRLTAALPTQAIRSGKQLELQQFSTPPAYSFAAAYVAKLSSDDRLLEPSAGTGSLAIYGQKARAHVTVNEIDIARSQMLAHLKPDVMKSEDGRYIGDILKGDAKPTVVVMNPPFSADAVGGTANKTMTGAEHVESALRALQPGGRLVAIVGKGMARNTASFRAWWRKIDQAYNVRAAIEINGQIYAKYGTSFDSVLLVIDKTEARTAEPLETRVESVADLIDELREIRNDRSQPSPRQRPGAPGPAGSEAAGEPAADVSAPAADALPDDRGAPAGSRDGEPTEGLPGAGGRGAAGGAAAVPRPPRRPAGRSGGARGAGAEPAAPTDGSSDRDRSVGELAKSAAKHGIKFSDETLKGLATLFGPPGTIRSFPGGVDPETYAAAKPHFERAYSEAVAAGKDLAAMVKAMLEWAGRGIEPYLRYWLQERRASMQAGDAVSPPESTVESAPVTAATDEPQTSKDLTDDVYETYVAKRRMAGSKPHPADLSETAAMGDVDPPATAYVPNLPQELLESGALSDAQTENIVLAGAAHQRVLPAAEGGVPLRQGFLVGDGTGVGKAREMLGIVLDNHRQGRKKALYVSKNQELINDLREEWKGLGQNPNQIVALAETSGAVRGEQGILYTTYPTLGTGRSAARKGASTEFVKGRQVRHKQLRSVGTVVRVNPKGEVFVLWPGENTQPIAVQKSELEPLGEKKDPGNERLEQIKAWLGADFDGVIVFDEAHLMANAVQVKGGRGSGKPSEQAQAGIELAAMFPNARVVYASATAAQEVRNLSYMDRLGLWGPGTSFADKLAFINQIMTGGVAAMELVAKDMKAMGVYLARSISFKGLTRDTIQHQLTPEQREIYNELARAWGLILNNIQAFMEETGADKNPQAKSRTASLIWGFQQRFFNQVITSMKMPSVLAHAEAALEDGRAVVFQLVNTGDAGTKRALGRMEQSGQDLSDLDTTGKADVIAMVRKVFPTQKYRPEADDDGKTTYVPVVDSEGNPVEDEAAVAAREALIQNLNDIRIPEAPLDQIINRFGADKVSEVTGRTRRIVRDPRTGEPELQTTPQSEAEIAAFQSGKKLALVFSNAGGTGKSYHADLRVKNQRIRNHYLVQGGWSATPAVQGFGRTHRSNQKQPPHLVLTTTDVQAEKRFTSSIARRLDQLGALTRGQRKTGGQGMFSAEDNLETEYATGALSDLMRAIGEKRVPGIVPEDLKRELGLNVFNEDTGALNESAIPEVTKLLNRLLSVPLERMDLYFNAFFERLETAIETAKANGDYDAGVENLVAEKVEIESRDVVFTDPRTKAETEYVKLELTDPVEYRQFYELAELAKVREFVAFGRNKKSGKVYAFYKGQPRTTKEGAIIDTYRRVGISSMSLVEEREIRFPPENYPDATWANHEKLEPAAAKEAWDAEIKDAPSHKTWNVHMIVGAVLPVWDRLLGKPRIFRTVASGQRLLGRVIADNDLKATLRNLGVGAKAVKKDPANLFERVRRDNYQYRLSNGWMLKKKRVGSENRVMISGPSFGPSGRQAEQAGAIKEIIQHQTTYFATPDVIKKLIELNIDVVEEIVPGADEAYQIAEAEFTGEATKKFEPVMKALKARLDEIGIGDRVTLRLKDVITDKDGAIMARARGRYFARIIEIAMATGDKRHTLDHEIIHALKDLGVIRDAEWQALTAKAQADAPLMKMIRAKYGPQGLDLPESKILEEAVAELFANWVSGKFKPTGFIRTAFERIRDFIEAVRSAWRGQGFQSAESIFKRIDRGEVGARPSYGRGGFKQKAAFDFKPRVVGEYWGIERPLTGTSGQWEDVGEGPFDSRKEAEAFLKGEVGAPGARVYPLSPEQVERFEAGEAFSLEDAKPAKRKPTFNPTVAAKILRGPVPTFSDPKTEARWREARKGLASVNTWLSHMKDGAETLRNGFTRHWIHLPNEPKFSPAREQLRVLEAAPQASKDQVVRVLTQITEGMTAEDLDLFTRKVVLEDLKFEVLQEHELPFGLTPESQPEELERVDAALATRPDLLRKLAERKTIVDLVADDMVRYGVLHKEQIKNPAYYRHQVLDYARLQKKYARGAGQALRSPHWAKRKGSRLDINANLLEAEFEWMQKALTDIAIARTITWFKESQYNVRDSVRANAKAHNARLVDKLLADDLQARGWVDKNGNDTSPLTEEWKSFKGRIAVAFQKISEAIENGTLDGIPREFDDVVASLLDPEAPSEGSIFPFLAWIIDHDKPAAAWAASAFKAVNQRKAWVRNHLGDKYADPMRLDELVDRGFAPEGYRTWQPDEGNLLFTAKTLPQHVIDKMLKKIAAQSAGHFTAEELTQAFESVQSMLAVGGPKYQLVIPEELADTLANLKDTHAEGLVDFLAAKPLGAWKIWTLISPRRWFKYNFNNLSGDLDAVIAGAPRVLKKLPAAIGELYDVMLKGKTPSQNYRDAVERGVFDSGLTVQEIPDINYLSEFRHLVDQSLARKALEPFAKLWRGSRLSTQFRENWMRYAAYLDYLERLEAGESMRSIGYGAANKAMVDEINEDEFGPDWKKAKAALLARELVGDYGAISHFGKGIRRTIMPFYSWTEINLKRYWRLSSNAWDQGAGHGFRTAGIIGATLGLRTTSYLFLRMAVLYGLVQAWNNLVWGDEEDDLPPEERARLHLIVGRDADGQVVTMRFQGSFSDVLDWIGFGDAVGMHSEIERGRASWKDLLQGMAKAPVNKLAGGVTPVISAPIELAFEQEAWPDVFNPRPIRDRGRYAAQLFALEHEYDLIFDKPSRGYGRSLTETVVNRRDPGEVAYNRMRGMVFDWSKRTTGQSGTGYQTPRSKALYEWRQAKRFGDRNAERVAEQRLRDLGVKGEDRRRSIENAHPLGSLSLRDKAAFRRSLTAAERATLEDSIRWYRATYFD
jgi:predicted RNA methylase